MLQWEGNILSVVCFPKIHNFNPITIFSCPDLCGGREPCIQVPGGQWSLEIGAEVCTRENMEDSEEKSEFIRVEFVPSTLWSPPNSPFPPPTALHFYINSCEPIQRYIPHRGDKHRGHTSHRHILSHTCTQPREGYTEEHTPRSHSGTHTQLHRSQRSIHMYSHTYTCPWVTGIQTHTCTTRHTHTHK